jgi:ribosomal protein S18 acetylase RimI-like enzyme
MISNLALRPETSADGPLLYELYASTREDELALTNWDAAARESFLRMQFNAQRVAYREMFPAGEFSVVLAGGGPIGRVVVNRTTEEIRLVDLVIAPARRNHGIGTVLMKKLISESNETNRPLRLHVLRGSRAFNWYQQLGFRGIGDSEFYTEMERTAVTANA